MRMPRRLAVPGPYGIAVWLFLLLPAPLIWHELSHRWEEPQRLTEALPFALAAVPLLTAATAARSHGRPLPVLAWSMLVGALTLAASVAFHTWVVPLPGTLEPAPWLLAALPITAAAAVIGRRGGRPMPRRLGYLAGALTAIAGALLAPVTVRLAAEAATRSTGHRSAWFDAGEAYTADVHTPGSHAIWAVGRPPDEVDCALTGAQATRRAEPLPIPPGSYPDGGDAASLTWIATIDVPQPGRYTLQCSSPNEDTAYRETFSFGTVPDIAGAAGTPIHWPEPVIRLAGTAPGLLIIAANRRLPVGRTTNRGIPSATD